MFVSKKTRMALRIVMLNLTTERVETLDALRALVTALPDTARGKAVEWVNAVLGCFTVDGEVYDVFKEIK